MADMLRCLKAQHVVTVLVGEQDPLWDKTPLLQKRSGALGMTGVDDHRSVPLGADVAVALGQGIGPAQDVHGDQSSTPYLARMVLPFS